MARSSIDHCLSLKNVNCLGASSVQVGTSELRAAPPRQRQPGNWPGRLGLARCTGCTMPVMSLVK